MSKNKGFSTTTAKRYSLALYELASEASKLPNVEENSLALLNLVSTNNNFNSLIKDPTISQDKLIEIIAKISENFYQNSLVSMLGLQSFLQSQDLKYYIY